ncbi:MAG: hypothetical protein SVR94_05610, partial [Pseudomonadota bacterium]|nr:hypothetical protein [Pseudomonadota bacterium]
MNQDELTQELKYAQQQFAQNNTYAAIKSLRQILTLDEQMAEAHALLALTLLTQQRYYGAQQEAKRALSLAPQLPMAHYAQAQVWIAQRQFKRA